jgi:hypothetical protein
MIPQMNFFTQDNEDSSSQSGAGDAPEAEAAASVAAVSTSRTGTHVESQLTRLKKHAKIGLA